MFRTAFRRYFSTAAAAKNPKVFFDINIDGTPVGRIVFEVWNFKKTFFIF